jgi:DNA-binding response OmpR family regulator
MPAEQKAILIVEDEEPLLKALDDILSDQGYKTLKAKDGKQGLESALANKPDLILLDILLPKLNGMELLKKLRKDKWGKTARVVLLSNLSDSQHIADALDLGVRTYLLKSEINIDNVIQKIEEQLAAKK